MLHWNTINDLLKQSLLLLMASEEFSAFRLVGGTSLSLQVGHRMSIDIDLFTDNEYKSVDFGILENFLTENFDYVSGIGGMEALGKSYLVGTDKDNAIKLDIYYTDGYIRPYLQEEGVRLAAIEDIIAMKLDVIQREYRKKDYWDLHELLPQYGIDAMLALHQERYPYNHDRTLILARLRAGELADDDFDPDCLHGKYWQFIKEDIRDAAEGMV